MSWVAVKALFFRYVYMLRHRRFSLVMSVVLPLILFLELLWLESILEYREFHRDIEKHDAKSLTVIPWQMQIVVCPDGAKERRLLERVQKILRVQNVPTNDAPLKITYVNTTAAMIGHLARWHAAGLANSSRGLHFNEITESKLEYTIRPLVPNITAAFTDWGAYRTAERFPSPMDRGPRRQDSYFDVYWNGKIIPGIIQLQVAIDQAYIQSHISNTTAKWQLLSFPYPVYSDLYRNLLAILGFTVSSTTVLLVFVQFLMTAGIVVIVSVLCSNIIMDKMSGIRELLSINGAPRWMVNTSWQTACIFEATILAVVEMLIFKSRTQSAVQYMTRPVLTIVLIVLNWSSICWVCFMSSLFTSASLCSILISVWWLVTPILFQFIPPDRFILHGLIAILPNAGFVLIFKAFQEFDGAETELGLNRLFTPPIHYLSAGIILLIMVATMVMLLILVFYVDLVKPGPYGTAMPWYLFTRKEKSAAWQANDAAVHDGIYFEDIDSKDPVGLECVNLYKFFGQHKAVDNVNLKILKNRITVLLGHNGAGKTTLFSILCGMHSPTKGYFYTDHYDVFEANNIKRFRKALGYCPQSNLLLDDLTVNQHLVIFGLLKGLSREDARKYSDAWTALFEMEDMRTTQAKKLSGGTRRKLCLAIAMTGDPEYLLLDEPSSGLDVESIRKFWNIILQEKGKCTIVLSTHNMDESEILGDMIAFMGNGQLKAYGSTTFLKMKLETGYKLSCATDEKELENFMKAVKKLNHSATIIHHTNRSVTFGLPSDKPKDIPNLMKSLESEFGDNIALRLSRSTMDDVFIKLLKKETVVNLEGIVTQEAENYHPQYFSFGQLKELFKKRLKWLLYRRLIAMITVVIGLPGMGMILSMYIINEISGLGKFSELNNIDLELTLDKYSGSSALISRTNGDNGGALKLVMSSSGIRYEEVDHSMVQALQEKAKNDLFNYRSNIVFAFETHYVEPIAYYSRNAFHSAPIAYSALINALLQGKATIVTHNFPYVQESEACSVSPLVGTVTAAMLGDMLLMAASYFVIFPHEEKQSLFKHLQLMTGLLPVTYWISNLIFDMAVFLSSCILMLSILAAMDNDLFLNPTVTGALTVVLILYGISAVLLAYILSFCWYKNTSKVVLSYIGVNSGAISLYFIAAILLAFIGIFFELQYLYFLPWIILLICLRKISLWAGIRRKCYKCRNEIACTIIAQDPLLGKLKKELISFACIAMVYFSVVLVLDHGLGRRLMAVIRQGFYKDYEDTKDDIDPEVAKEKQRVRDLEMSETLEQPELLCNGLGKKYSRKVVAVRNVTFATELGELFGILGANGAGKTTTFGMLSGLISPTKGDAGIRGQWQMGDCEYKYIKNIGYCPQFEGILPGLTGRTILRLFGHLRWVKLDALDSHVEQWLEALDMTSLADRPCEQYSGGNKRKLSFAAAMIGNPSVVLLDEPTTGIDPVIRRRIWEILMISLKQHNQAIVLTSHTMSECEAICDRLTILVKGEMKCLGPVPKLKNTFGKSCTLQVRLQDNMTLQETNAIQSQILSQFSGHITLQEKQLNLLTFNVKTEKTKIYDVFAVMLKIKEANSGIDDFSLAETPLEDIFLMFAQGS